MAQIVPDAPVQDLDAANAFFDALSKDPRSFLLLALIAVGLLCRASPRVSNNLIPSIITATGIGMSLVLFSPWSTAVLYGLIFSAIAVYSYEIVRRTFLAATNVGIIRRIVGGETRPPFSPCLPSIKVDVDMPRVEPPRKD